MSVWLKIAGVVGAAAVGAAVGYAIGRAPARRRPAPARGRRARAAPAPTPTPPQGDVDDARDDWWQTRRAPERTLCYRTKVDALQAFRDANRRIIDQWGGIDQQARPADFDAVNRRYGLEGKHQARTLARAMWTVMPPHPPFCLDTIDLEALNDTAPGQRGQGFVLPEWAYEQIARREEARYYRDLPEPEADAGDDPVPF